MSKTPEILVAEDDPNLGLLLTEFLKKKGYAVSWAQNGDEALDLFVKGNFDLCLLDVMMPKKSGFEVCQEIKADPALGGVRILMLTAKGQGRDREAAERAGVSAFMAKPFANAEMRAKVRALLEG